MLLPEEQEFTGNSQRISDGSKQSVKPGETFSHVGVADAYQPSSLRRPRLYSTPASGPTSRLTLSLIYRLSEDAYEQKRSVSDIATKPPFLSFVQREAGSETTTLPLTRAKQ